MATSRIGGPRCSIHPSTRDNSAKRHPVHHRMFRCSTSALGQNPAPRLTLTAEYIIREIEIIRVTRRCSKLENTLFSEEESKIPRLIAILHD
jgi:hypothetical protein